MGWGNIAIVTRHGSTVHPRFVQSWSRLMFQGMRPDDMLLDPAVRFHAHKGANAIIEWFLTDPDYDQCDTLCFVDDDHVFPSDTLEKLRTNEDGWEYDVLGGLHVTRGSDSLLILGIKDEYADATPYEYFAMRSITDWEPGDVVDVDGIGLGFTLIRREVFGRISEKFPGEQFQFSHTTLTSNDLIWSRKAKLSGARIGVDTNVPIGHLIFDATAWPNVKHADG